MGKLTNTKIRKHLEQFERALIAHGKSNTVAKSLADGLGLSLRRLPSGSWMWCYRYREKNKQKMISFGTFPDVEIEEAREKLAVSRALVREGNDPVRVRAENKQKIYDANAHTFKKVALAWYAAWLVDGGRGGQAVTGKHGRRTLSSMETYLFPSLSDLPIASIKLKHLSAAFKSIKEAGAGSEVVRKLWIIINYVFRYARVEGILDANILEGIRAADLKIAPAESKNQARVQVQDLPKLLTDIDSIKSPLTRLGLNLMALTFVRHNELISAEWQEIDFDKKVWVIPAEKMKRVNRTPTEHIVPLSKQALVVLSKLRQLTGHKKYVFASNITKTKHISIATLMKGLTDLGYQGKQSVHGFRGLASTILNENKFKFSVYDAACIAIQLAHVQRDKTSAAYNHAAHLEARTKMMQIYADFLDEQRRMALLKVV